MRWKDFLHYQRRSRLAVILLLILILLTMILNGVLRYGRRSEMMIMQNETLIQEFDSFLQTLKERDPSPQERDRNEGFAGYATERKKDMEKTICEEDRVARFASFPTTEKLTEGETIRLNETDTTQWKKVPGIGGSYASRIVKYRELLGGYIRAEQLLEVYGMDNERYGQIIPFIKTDTIVRRLKVNELEFKELLQHPYLNYNQVQAIISLRRRKGNIVSIGELAMLDEFTSDDIDRLEPYLEF